jgi:hypothetical protein
MGIRTIYISPVKLLETSKELQTAVPREGERSFGTAIE